MNYDLAKELKDAGFPQPNFEQNQHRGWMGKVPQGHSDFEETLCYVPTLSELIEACGEKFYDLCRYQDDAGLWHALSDGEVRPDLNNETCDQGCCGKNGHGSTPEEAVARLWLSLNPTTVSAPII